MIDSNRLSFEPIIHKDVESYTAGWEAGQQFARGQAGCISFLLGIITGACAGLVAGWFAFS